MRLRSRLRLCAIALLATGAAACTDDSPLLTGDPFFPDGRPVTLEAILPASQFLTLRGSFTGYTDARSVSYRVVANSFDGALNAHTLVRIPTPFPQQLEYIQDGTTRRDSVYAVTRVDLVLHVDSAGSVLTNVPLTASRITETWQDTAVTWEVRARDSSGTRLWTQPGGTASPVLGTGTYRPADSASVATIPLPASEFPLLRDSTYPGFLIRSAQPGTRLELTNAQLRISVRPSNAVRDTTITLTRDVSTGSFAFVYTPQPPQPAGLLQAGSVRSARTLLSVDLPDSLDVCTRTCSRRALKDLALNQVSLLLRARSAPSGFRLLPTDSAAVVLRTVTEPELGRQAPLGDNVSGRMGPRGPLPAVGIFGGADTLVEVPFTLHAAQLVRGDTVPSDFALIGSTTGAVSQPPFSLLLFDAAPRLRIVFTVPERPRLP